MHRIVECQPPNIIKEEEEDEEKQEEPEEEEGDAPGRESPLRNMADQNKKDTEEKFYNEILRSVFFRRRGCLLLCPGIYITSLNFFKAVVLSSFPFFVHVIYRVAKF